MPEFDRALKKILSLIDGRRSRGVTIEAVVSEHKDLRLAFFENEFGGHACVGVTLKLHGREETQA